MVLRSLPLFSKEIINLAGSTTATTSTGRSWFTYIAFLLTLIGAVWSTIVVILSIPIQQTITFPYLHSISMEYLILNYIIADWRTIIGAILLYLGALIIILHRIWPAGTILAIIGAITTVTPYSIILGFIGGIIGFFSRPEQR